MGGWPTGVPVQTVPILPCPDLGEALEFYGALGFRTAFTQQRPNPYAVVRREGWELHLRLGEDEQARELLDEVARTPLSDEERARATAALSVSDELRERLAVGS